MKVLLVRRGWRAGLPRPLGIVRGKSLYDAAGVLEWLQGNMSKKLMEGMCCTGVDFLCKSNERRSYRSCLHKMGSCLCTSRLLS